MTATTREDGTLELLDRKAAELASFLSPAEIFRALLEGTASGAPRAAIYLLRDGRWKGWSSIGYPEAAAARQRQVVLSGEGGWLGALAAEDDVRWRTLLPGEDAPEFGQGPESESVGLPVRVSGKAVAMLVAQRADGEEPWSPPALSILCQAARLRLELDLAWRRLKSLQAARETVEPAAAVRPPSAASPTPVPVTIDPGATEVAVWSDAATEPADPRREEARRYARLVATDIRLYNEEAVVLGRKGRDLAARLKDPIARGREAFARRFPEMGAQGTALLEEALVNVLAGGDATLLR